MGRSGGVTDINEPRFEVGVQGGPQSGLRFGLHDSGENATQTDVVDEQVDEVPTVMDFDQFLVNYEAAWEWGLQNPRSGFFQQGDLVVFPTSPGSSDSPREEGQHNTAVRGTTNRSMLAGGNGLGCDTESSGFEYAVSQLSWVLKSLFRRSERWTAGGWIGKILFGDLGLMRVGG